MNPADFIATAKDLVQANTRGRPRETNLRRAVSTAYYALFHGLAECCADMLVGGSGANRSQRPPRLRHIRLAVHEERLGPAQTTAQRKPPCKLGKLRTRA